MRLIIIFFLFFVCFANYAVAQDSVAVAGVKDTGIVSKHDSVIKKKFQPDAKRAGLYASLFPGLGQIYNRQYWKVPVVYAVMGTTVYFAVKRNSEYQKYRKAYVSRIEYGDNSPDEFQGVLNVTGIKQYQDEAKQSRDLMIVYTVIGFAGQILEAISGAHLRNFDISKDLSMQVKPVLTPENTFGVGLVVNFKK